MIDIPKDIMEELTIICNEDEHGLKEEFLFKNILNSSGPVEQIAKLFEVDVDLVHRIWKLK